MKKNKHQRHNNAFDKSKCENHNNKQFDNQILPSEYSNKAITTTMVDFTSPENKPLPYNVTRDSAVDDQVIANNVVFKTNNNTIIEKYMQYIGKYIPDTEIEPATKAEVVQENSVNFDNKLTIANTKCLDAFACRNMVGDTIEIDDRVRKLKENALYNCTIHTLQINGAPQMSYMCMRGTIVENLKMSDKALDKLDSCMERDSALLYLGLPSSTKISRLTDDEMTIE